MPVSGINNKQFWITISLVNLSIVALLGCTLRSKILFPLRFLNYEFFVGAHSHFAFGGWITLSFLNLFTYTLLPPGLQQRPWYQWMLWGLLLTSWGMLLSFPFQGYGLIAILFSTLFILFTYGYSACFIKDLLSVRDRQPVSLLAPGALICLVLSSAGPFTLAYILASGNTDAILYKDAIYFYLHFQYNGFFALAVFALLFDAAYKSGDGYLVPVAAKRFAWFLCAAVIPSFFLSLLWHSGAGIVRALAVLGVALIVGSLFFVFQLGRTFPLQRIYRSSIARALWFLALLSFVIKSLLQMGTIFPDLGNAVFGLRPIIIGFLHLVFLGLASFYILSNYIGAGVFNMKNSFVRWSILVFASAVVIQETILLVQGAGLLLGNANPVYNWLLWLVSIMLFTGALLLVIARVKSMR